MSIRGGLCVLVLATAGLSHAQTREDGIFAGPWVLTPAFAAGIVTDSNVFRVPFEGEQFGDQIFAATVGLGATMPFRGNLLALNYEATKLDYNKFNFDRDLAQAGGVGLLLNLGVKDKVNLSGRYIQGITDVRDIDPGGEFTFTGQPYDKYVWDVTFQRNIPGRRGYEVGITGSALNFVNRTQVNFFDYRGNTAGFEYREPVNPHWWAIAAVTIRDYDHYLTSEPPGTVFRREESKLYEIGVRGLTGHRQPFVLTVGYGDYQFPGSDASDFQGLVGRFRWRLPVGSATWIQLGAGRRARPSFFGDQSHFVSDEILMVAERSFRQHSSVGLDVLLGRNQYPDPEPVLDPSTGEETMIKRSDKRFAMDLYFDFKLNRLFGFRVSLTKERRDSNIFRFNYDAFTTFAGVTLGWI